MSRTAIYNSLLNSITEISQMEKPTMPIGAVHLSTAYAYERALAEYNAHLSQLRTIPCSPDCVGKFIHDCEYEEGKDYEIKGAGDWKWCTQLKGNVFAAPVVPVKSEDELWKDVFIKYHEMKNEDKNIFDVMSELKKKYTITRKQ